MTIDIKRAVSDNHDVHFQYYRDGDLWYQTDFGEVFPVPIADLGTATCSNVERAILFMRYMKRWNKTMKAA